MINTHSCHFATFRLDEQVWSLVWPWRSCSSRSGSAGGSPPPPGQSLPPRPEYRNYGSGFFVMARIRVYVDFRIRIFLKGRIRIRFLFFRRFLFEHGPYLGSDSVWDWKLYIVWRKFWNISWRSEKNWSLEKMKTSKYFNSDPDLGFDSDNIMDVPYLR